MDKNQTDARIGRAYEEVWDERSIYIDKNIKSEYKPMYEMNTKPCAKENSIFRKNAVKGIHDETLLNQLFFSHKNIKNIQNKIRYTIWKMSREQFVIPEQNEVELQVVMRSIYLQYSRNLPHNIKEQINELNNIVVDNIAPDLLSNVKQYVRYLEDKNEPYRLMQRPVSLSAAGTKTLSIHTALGFGDPTLNFE
jgi:hypothetical protein